MQCQFLPSFPPSSNPFNAFFPSFFPSLSQSLCFLSATTHIDLAIRAKEMGIKVQVIHNASIMNAIGSCGLSLYNYGHTVSIPFFDDAWRPDSFYPKIEYNKKGGMHTLCLLGAWPSAFTPLFLSSLHTSTMLFAFSFLPSFLPSFFPSFLPYFLPLQTLK